MRPTRAAKSPSDDEGDRIAAKASEWLVAWDRGMNAADRKKFDRWRLADSRHAAAFAEMEETWSIMARSPAPPLASLPEVTINRTIRRWIPLTAAAAAAVLLAVGYFGWWQPRLAPYSGAANTEIGGLEQMTLPDGSVVQLNTDSAVEVQYTAAVRRVKLLRGEAHFSVAKNPARPFLVFAGGVDVRAVGTAFDVRLRAEVVDVLVTEGRVRLERPAAAALAESAPAPELPALAFLKAGEKASVPLILRPSAPAAAPVAVIPVAEDAMVQALAWRERQLQFSTATLADVVAEFNRYNRHQLVIDDRRLATQRFGGTFPADDSTGFVQLLEREFGVVAQRRSGETTLRLAR
jgi:transmembrane sensor